MDSHHSYQKNVDQNINRKNTLLAPDALMPGVVIEKNSREEYSQLDMPLSRLDTIS